MSDPTPGMPGWLPDPSGRHELRWFDGTRFSDQVADAGVQATDPGEVPTTPPAAAEPGRAPTSPTGVQAPADVSGHTASRVPLIVGVVLALAVVVALVTVVLGDDGDGGFGTFDGEITTDDGAGTHSVSVPAGSAAVVEVDPGRDLDAIVAFVVAEDDADRLADLYEGSPFEQVAGADPVRDALGIDPDDLDGLPEDPVAVLRRDAEFEGDNERTLLPTSFDLDAIVVVSGFDGSEGGYEIRIERVDLGVDDDADGNDLFEAVLDADDIPRSLREDVGALRDD